MSKIWLMLMVQVCVVLGLKNGVEFHHVALDDLQVGIASKAAMKELQKVSDSGVYESLRLDRVKTARQGMGRFFDVLELVCEVSSPHLVQATEELTFSVMRDKGTRAIRTVTLDRLPEMKVDAIEMFRLQKIERAKENRRERFDQLERDFVTHTNFHINTMPQKSSQIEELRSLPTKTLRDMKPHATPEIKQLIDVVIDERLIKLEKLERGEYIPTNMNMQYQKNE